MGSEKLNENDMDVDEVHNDGSQSKSDKVKDGSENGNGSENVNHKDLNANNEYATNDEIQITHANEYEGLQYDFRGLNTAQQEALEKKIIDGDERPFAVIKREVIREYKYAQSRAKQNELRADIANGTIRREDLLECLPAARYKTGKTFRYRGHYYNYVQAYKIHVTIKCIKGFFFFCCFFCFVFV